MKNMRNSVLALCSALSLGFTDALADGFEVGNVTYTIVSTSAVTAGKGTEAYDGSLVISSSVSNGGSSYQVVGITAKGFENCDGLSAVSLPEGVTTIGDYAFHGCSGLESVSFPSSVKSIGASAFYDCTSLSSVVIPSSVTSVGDYAFSGCRSLGGIVIEEGVSSLGKYCFQSCRGLMTVSLPSSLKSIPEKCFSLCASLSSIDVPQGVETVEAQAFEGDSALVGVSLPKGVETIGVSAFANCVSLPSVEIPASVSTIKTKAFYGCSALAAVKALCAQAVEPWSDAFTGLPASAVLTIPAGRKGDFSSWMFYFGGGVKLAYSFNESDDAGDVKRIGVADTAALADIFLALADPEYQSSTINLTTPLAFSPVKIDLDNLSGDDAASVFPNWATAPNFSGIFEGNTVSNLTAASSGLFGTVSGEVNNLMLENATIYADPTSDAYATYGDTVYVSVLARENKGMIQNFGISGRVVVDADKLPEGKVVVVCLVGDNDGDALTGFTYLDEAEAISQGDSKKCIAIKQNLCTGRNKKLKSTKVAMRRATGAKAAAMGVDLTEARFSQGQCYFSDMEFQNGLVAYWLNFSGPGFTGEYTGEWKQGVLYPVGAKGKANALYKVDYDILPDDMDKLTSATTFANGGGTVTIAYTQKPSSITVGGVPVTPLEGGASFAYSGGQKVSVRWSATALTDADAALGVSVLGGRVSVSGADGLVKRLFTLGGTLVGETEGNDLVVSSPGAYIVRVGSMARMVIVR